MILSGRIADVAHVPESRFGQWFLATDTWAIHVLTRAIDDLDRLVEDRRPHYPVVVDVGCGFGRSFKLLKERFGAKSLIGIDIETEALTGSAKQAKRDGLAVELLHANSSDLPLVSESADIVFCHQTLHHLVEQESALSEFHRILRPGGLFLLAESTRAYIHSWIIRLLFRHPMHVQRSADEYLAMVRAAGFSIDPHMVSYPYLWWSRHDFGLCERALGIKPRPGHEETLINLVGVKR